jgi:hypothetical protein
VLTRIWLLQVPGVFDEQRRCCASGNLDACGVCDGAGDQCGTEASGVIDTSTGQGRKLLQASSFIPAPENLTTLYGDVLGYHTSEFEMLMDATIPTETAVRSHNAISVFLLPNRKVGH